MPGEYQVSATFNVADLSLFDVGYNSRTNYFQEERDDSSMDTDEAIEAQRRPSRSQDKELQPTIVGLQWEIKKMLIIEGKPTNESKNCEEEWSRCYTYFMVQVQAQMEEDWATQSPAKEPKKLNG